jgi:hypothetical protein
LTPFFPQNHFYLIFSSSYRNKCFFSVDPFFIAHPKRIIL